MFKENIKICLIIVQKGKYLSGNRSSLNIVLITEDPKIRNFTALRGPSTNNRNTGNKSLDNSAKKIKILFNPPKHGNILN